MPDGRSVVYASNRGGSWSLWKVSAAGGAPERLGIGANANSPTVSRTGQRLAYVESLEDWNLWRIEGPKSKSQDRRPFKLIASTKGEMSPQFSPDGKKIVFSSDRLGNWDLWVCDSTGLNAVQLTSFGGPLTGTPAWSPDGRWIAFDSRPGGNPDIFVVSAEGGNPRRLTTEPGEDVVPSWSSDGRWIYFASSRTGGFQVWKVPSDGGSAIQVTRKGGFYAHESPDGKYLYYAKGRDNPSIWRIPIAGGEETLVVERNGGGWGHWAVAADGLYLIAPEERTAGSRRVTKYVIKFFSFGTGQITDYFPLEKEPPPGTGALAISPDGQWMLYTQVDQSGSDIMLVENFR